MLLVEEINIGDLILAKRTSTVWLVISKRIIGNGAHSRFRCVFMNIKTHLTYSVQNYLDDDICHLVKT
jgi:hypothetical protein